MREWYNVEICGIDIDKKFSNKYKINNINFINGDVENIPVKNNTFDYIYSFFVIPYVHDKLKGIKEIHRVLKVGGSATIFIDAGREDRNSIIPPIKDIINKLNYDNQIKIDIVGIHPYLLFKRANITKKSEEELKFPEINKFEQADIESKYYPEGKSFYKI